MLTIERPKQSNSRPGPFSFGDVVIPKGERFVDICHSEVIFLPDLGCRAALSFQIAHRIKGIDPFVQSNSDWNMLKRVGRYAELPDEVKQLIQPYRKGVVINGTHFDMGVNLFEEDEIEILKARYKGDSTHWDDLGLGNQSLYEKFFGTAQSKWRVFVHLKEDWSTWNMYGPFDREEKARLAFERYIEESKCNPPRLLRHGVYENKGQINVVVLYQGFDMREYWSCLVGQGENDAGGIAL
jgi:hypothetical protein